MNWQDVQENWLEISKKARSNWNKLPMDEISATAGDRAQLSALIQKHYECSDQKAGEQLDEWMRNLLGNTQHTVVKDPALDDKLEANLDTPETIKKHDDVVGSPYHRTI